ncbi:hypothetical protein GCM10022243_43990 [Saccharothrix violaceirubra]|uniref:CdiI C-terminal domain-containing protein n=1 Tax=Saccharothrix violaceirubra TaxID=413306 RepID=A0A7W7WVT5_9PSEU|nr:hypothetical protein [Saccharothrix violaceirubra]MBB4965689.1 hypothetical protein [Saccharothrix violaceirubra]
MFAIEVEDSSDAAGVAGGSSSALGWIKIDDFVEWFRAPIGFWVESDYRRSWREAYLRLEISIDSTSCLLVSVTDPAVSNFLTCWPMYRDGEKVYLQNSLIFLGEVGPDFDISRPWCHVLPRAVVNEDGMRISEWATSMDSIREFFV